MVVYPADMDSGSTGPIDFNREYSSAAAIMVDMAAMRCQK